MVNPFVNMDQADHVGVNAYGNMVALVQKDRPYSMSA
jgi:hypothetical protein